MNKRDTLSIAPYYGGKGRMAHFIADRLNYDDSDIFVTPFGGMCRVLLNKPRHKVECYNDYSSGLTALMRILSDPVQSIEFIHRLEDETVYSQEEFDKQKAIFDYAEKDYEMREWEVLRQMLIDEDRKIVDRYHVKELLDKITYEVRHPIPPKKSSKKARIKVQVKVSDDTQAAFERWRQQLKDKEFCDKFQLHLNNWALAHMAKKEQDMIERASDIDIDVDEMDLAIATYVVFQQSRDGMGQTWSAEKFKTNDQYRRQIVKLFDCAERLEGVEVFQIDAIDFFRRMMFVDVYTPLGEIPPQFRVLNEWINNPRVMMYCDPSYISVESEKKLLEGIDVDKTPRLSEAIKKKYGDRMPKNLGKVYAMSFGYDDQEKFLRCIQKAKCRILVSNYDLQLYNKYLNEDTGWHREEFHTTTGVGGKKDNKRVEVIWYNY